MTISMSAPFIKRLCYKRNGGFNDTEGSAVESSNKAVFVLKSMFKADDKRERYKR